MEPKRRFGRLVERPDGRDFPFYDGDPLALTSGRWLAVVAACVVGFLALVLIPAADQYTNLVNRVLFPAIPLALFIAFTGRRWSALFRRLGWADVGTMIVFWLLNAAVSAIVAAVFLGSGVTTAANGAVDGLVDQGPGQVVAFFVGTGIQLFGEEVFTILPFLAVMYWMTAKAGTSRTTAVVVAWLVTALWFAAAHLPTYGWNVVQALVGIGIARLVLTLAFIRTKNLAVSTGAHVLNDWSGFAVALVAASAQG